MHPLTAQELLQVWEQGSAQTPVGQALALLAAAAPEIPREQLMALPIGQRDGYLLTLREWTFGPHIDSVAHCPQCGEILELNFKVDEIRVPPTLEAAPLHLEAVGYQVHYRLPNSQDLDLVGTCQDPAIAQKLLLDRCLLEVVAPEVAAPDDLPPGVIAAVLAAMAEHDPQANVELALTCPTCQHAWTAAFDIVTFFWQEITTWARQLLWDIHQLARAYGWSEAEILALSSWRRQLYLEMVGL